MMKQNNSFKKIIKTAGISVGLLFVVVLLMGGGHGTYLPAKIIYPYSMILAGLKNEIGILAIVLAVLQVPFYVLILSKKPNWKYFIIVIHCIAIFFALTIKKGVF